MGNWGVMSKRDFKVIGRTIKLINLENAKRNDCSLCDNYLQHWREVALKFFDREYFNKL